MSKLILPSPVILASQSFDVNSSGVGPAGLATLSTDGTIEPLRFLIPTYSVVKDSSIDIEIFASSTLSANTYTLQPKLIFSEPDFGALNRVTYTLATLPVNTVAAQLIRFSIKVAFTKGANGDAAALKPYVHSVGTSADVDGGVRTNFETGTYAAAGTSPSLTFFSRPRALTVQLVRVGATNASVMNVNYIRAVGYNLNLDNATI
jgi:hypothetical protein